MYVVVTDRGEPTPDFKVFSRQQDANTHANACHNEGDCIVTIYSVSEQEDPRKAKWLVETEECELVKTLPRKLSEKEQAAVRYDDFLRDLGIKD